MKNISLGKTIQTLRKKNSNIETQEKLASLTGLERRVISELERDKRLPKKKEIKIIASVLGSTELEAKGLELIEYERTHPDVKLCYADDTPCWKCGEKMKTVYGLVNGYPIDPDNFNDEMLQIAKGKGVVLEERKSGTTGEVHMVNVCPHCGNFLGHFYTHELWYEETETIQIEDIKKFIIEDTNE